MHGPITSVTEADEARYERREAEKRGGGQEGHRDSGGHDEQTWSADWLSGQRGPRAPRPSAACRVNLSAAFEAAEAVEAVEADRREEVEAVEAVEAEWSATAATALRLDS